MNTIIEALNNLQTILSEDTSLKPGNKYHFTSSLDSLYSILKSKTIISKYDLNKKDNKNYGSKTVSIGFGYTDNGYPYHSQLNQSKWVFGIGFKSVFLKDNNNIFEFKDFIAAINSDNINSLPKVEYVAIENDSYIIKIYARKHHITIPETLYDKIKYIALARNGDKAEIKPGKYITDSSRYSLLKLSSNIKYDIKTTLSNYDNTIANNLNNISDIDDEISELELQLQKTKSGTKERTDLNKKLKHLRIEKRQNKEHNKQLHKNIDNTDKDIVYISPDEIEYIQNGLEENELISNKPISVTSDDIECIWFPDFYDGINYERLLSNEYLYSRQRTRELDDKLRNLRAQGIEEAEYKNYLTKYQYAMYIIDIKMRALGISQPKVKFKIYKR